MRIRKAEHMVDRCCDNPHRSENVLLAELGRATAKFDPRSSAVAAVVGTYDGPQPGRSRQKINIDLNHHSEGLRNQRRVSRVNPNPHTPPQDCAPANTGNHNRAQVPVNAAISSPGDRMLRVGTLAKTTTSPCARKTIPNDHPYRPRPLWCVDGGQKRHALRI